LIGAPPPSGRLAPASGTASDGSDPTRLVSISGNATDAQDKATAVAAANGIINAVDRNGGAITNAIQKLNASLAGPGSGGGTTGNVSITGNVAVVADQTLAQEAAIPSAADQSGAGSTAKSAQEGLITQMTGNATAPNVDSSSWMTLHFPASLGGAVIDFDPFTPERLGSQASWFRAAWAWLVLMLFGAWANNHVKDTITHATVAPQAKGNTVVAGTGAQATALAAAGIITASIAVFIVALLGVADLKVAQVASTVSTSPLIGLSTKAAYLLDGLFPVQICISTMIGRVTFPLVALKLYVGVCAVIRFVVP
jgi:hypothetical protein